jgi:hypothetical protein
MGALISYLAHLGIVRVAFVPTLIATTLYVLYVLAAPPEDRDEHGQEG